MRSRQNSVPTRAFNNESFTSFDYRKLNRLSHEELMIPLIYWSDAPKHDITAICVSSSLRFGKLLITGSNKGEFVIWKSNIDNNNNNNNNDNNNNNNIEWIATSMTFSTNTTSIKSIIGLTSYHEEISFMAIHCDGELVIFSIYGSGALKICRSERPIINDTPILNIYPFKFNKNKKNNDLYKYVLCTNYYNDYIHLIDINKGKQIKQYSLSQSIDDLWKLDDDHDNNNNEKDKSSKYNLNNNNLSKIIDIAFFDEKDDTKFICIDINGKMGIFQIDSESKDFKSIHSMDFKSRLRNIPISINCTFDNEYIIAISYNEFAVYSLKPSLSRIASKTEKNVNWNGMLLFDKYINYKMLPDHDNDNDHDDVDIINNQTTTKGNKTDDGGLSNNNYIVKKPFFVLLYEYNKSNITLYLVSKETSSILTPIVKLIVFEEDKENKIDWNIITYDEQYIYIGLQNGKILSFSMDNLRQITIESYKTLWKNEFRVMNTQFIGKLTANTIANIRNSFIPQKKHKQKVDRDESNDDSLIKEAELMLKEIRISDDDDDDDDDKEAEEEEEEEEEEEQQVIIEEEDNDITCSCMNITSYGVLLCIGYRNGSVYVYNISESKSILEIHTRLSSVTCLLLQCISGYKNHSNDGILFIGYQDGFIQIFNCDTGQNIFNKQCHYDYVSNLIQFEQDYYVFSIANDNSICSFLIYSQLVTMKSIIQQIDDDNDNDDESYIDQNNNNQNNNKQYDDDGYKFDKDKVKWNYYRGHDRKIINLYRNQWCLKNDFIAVELENGDIFVWTVATAQIERHFNDKIQAKQFRIDRSFDIVKRRNDLISNYKHKLFNIYDIKRNSSHLNVNTMILDIVSIFKLNSKSLNKNGNKFNYHDINRYNHTNNLNNAQYKIDDIIRVLSLLLDWDIHSTRFNKDFLDNFNQYLFNINYHQQRTINNNNNNNNINNDDLYNLLLIRDIKPCFGYIGDYQSITMLFPISSRNGGKWKMQSKFTSIYMLAISTLCIWLKKQIQSQKLPQRIIHSAISSPVSDISHDDHYDHHQQQQQQTNPNELILEFVNAELITFYSEILPSNLNGFIEPSRNTISRSCLSSTSSLRKTSRLLLENMVKRMEIHTKNSIILKWKNKFITNDGNNNNNNNNTSSRPKMNGYHKSNNDDDQKSASNIELLSPPRNSNNNNNVDIQSLSTSSMDIDNGYKFGDGSKIPLSVLFNAIIICIIHVQEKEKEEEEFKNDRNIKINIDKIVSSSVIKILISTLNETIHHKSDEIKKSLSCYYLGRVITSWQCSSDLFIKLLNILLDLCSDYDDDTQITKDMNILSESAMYALIQCGISLPSLFIKIMGQQSLQISKRGRHSKALQCIQRLIYTDPLSLLSHIPFTIKTIIKCLDPSSPQKRKVLLKSTTSTLHALVHKFPNCSFHSKTQHFAIADNVDDNNNDNNNYDDKQKNKKNKNSIVIYDLRTATRFGRALKQHKSTITAIEFNCDGKYLVSYSPYEIPYPLLCCWKLNTNDGVLGFFGQQSKCIKIIKLNKLNINYKPILHINNTQLIWDKIQKNKIKLQREDKSILYFNVF